MIQGGNRNMGAQQYWAQTSFSYKFICVLTLVLFIVGFVLPLAFYLVDFPEQTMLHFQIWRMFTASYIIPSVLMSVINLIFSFLWLHSLLKDEASTVYTLIQVFIIGFQIHLVFNLISLIFTIFFQTSQSMLFIGYGLFPVIVVYEFRQSVLNPQAQKRFCCLPFLIKSKYFPWVIWIFLTIFSSQVFCFVGAAIVGYYQQVVRKQMVIKLPFCLYKNFEKCIPESIVKRMDFVTVQSATNQLIKKCYSPATRANNNAFGSQQPNQNRNGPFYSEDIPSTVQASNGSKIGGQPATDYRNVWATKQQQLNKNSEGHNQGSTKNQEIQIQPRNNYQVNYEKQNDSYAALNDKYLPQKNLLEDEQARKQKQKQKKNKQQQNDNDLL